MSESKTTSIELSMQPLKVIFEDDYLLVVNKPSGMLSQPGKHEDGSVLSRVLASYKELTGPVLVHRLDMDTSGLLMLAKTRTVHKLMGQQFERRQIHKRYQAIVSRPLKALGGIIRLPLRLDIDNRPRQIVCAEHGKASVTVWRKTQLNNPKAVTLYPLTGRTHQLRVHAASRFGLGTAIDGDRLYGDAVPGVKESLVTDSQITINNQRLMLHADRLQFVHPISLLPISIASPAPF